MDLANILNQPSRIDTLLNCYQTQPQPPPSKRPRLSIQIIPTTTPTPTTTTTTPTSNSKQSEMTTIQSLQSPVSIVSWPPSSNIQPPVTLTLSLPALPPDRTNQVPSQLTLPFRTDVVSTTIPAARRLAQSRIVGQRHRTAERNRRTTLKEQVIALEEENQQLKDKIDEIDVSSQVGGGGGGGGYELNSKSAKVVDVTHISGDVALTMLEIIMLRRNLDKNCIVLECPSRSQVDEAVNGVQEDEDIKMLRWIHERWADYESDHVEFEDDSTFWEKRCSRCDMVKSAGSGHSRSFCNDGFKVGSNVPYQPHT